MVSIETIASIFIKALKLILNLIIILLYRTGDGGEFLGIGGTWNLNEEKSADCEIVASGVMIGFFIYTGCHTIAFLFGTTKHKRELSDTIINVVATFMWIAVGGTALHYWKGYMKDNDHLYVASERQVGLAMGALCVIEGALYLVDTVLACLHFSKGDTEYMQQ